MVEYWGRCKRRRILTYRVREDFQRRSINKLFLLPLAVIVVLSAFAVGTILATVFPLPEQLTWLH